METKVSVVIHVRELKLTSNTAYFAELLYPQQTHLLIRGAMDFKFEPEAAIDPERQNLFLYPDENAQVLDEDFKAKYPGPYNLIVPDGSWSQASKVYKREPKFHAIPTVKLPEGIEGEYRLRQSQTANQVCTLEAIAYALGILEGEHIQKHMLDFFKVFVDRVWMSRFDFYGEIKDDYK
jgi:DTW domain-containing protein YfiP